MQKYDTDSRTTVLMKGAGRRTQWKTAAHCNVRTGETRSGAVDVHSASRNDGRQWRSVLEVSDLLTQNYRHFTPTFWLVQVKEKGKSLLILFELMGQN